MSTEVEIQFTLNGRSVSMSVETSTVLLPLLRNMLELKGTRGSCERGVCGACTVLVDDTPVAACSVFAFDIDGTRVDTVEGQSVEGKPGPVQRAFVECGGFQCGFCTSGMIMTTTALLRHDPEPDRATATEWISSNTCRCTGYQMILDSVERASALTLAENGTGE
ncbi:MULTISPECIES: (2Fe-2S)-binding protein [unclassified Rhodococcus (in: high G+C Gram-positive bacteria)]|uniref:(2Fe-2S)-binding protein n=1 Tax=unclassified Rhodococcus (in: high G+C Gram-positive bacteria) TaxID=192944 RepID=UPI00211AE844|nr:MULTISPECIES: (2Fe-2S)-binding protein [unclassified Rhodococcus (in: high G+C Gram-positive bacteria)]